MRKLSVVLATSLVVLAGCPKQAPQEMVAQYQGRNLFTCCNIYYETDTVSDANYHVGSMLPFGTPVTIEKVAANAITFNAGGVKLTLKHDYGTQQESAQQYFDKILLADDPKTTVAAYPEQVRSAITAGRVEVGMTKPQVITSLGYPPTHRTANTSQPDWTYWYNRWVTYRVQFNEAGTVSGFIGTNVPTSNQPIVIAKPTPTAAPMKGKKKK